jgi:hypothetical protein
MGRDDEVFSYKVMGIAKNVHAHDIVLTAQSKK